MTTIRDQISKMHKEPLFKIIFAIFIFIVFIVVISLFNVYTFSTLHEGMEDESSGYKDYSDEEASNPMFLAMKNASNISVMKSQIDEMKGLTKRMTDVETKSNTNEESIQAMVEQIGNNGFGSLGIAPEDATDPANIPVIDGI